MAPVQSKISALPTLNLFFVPSSQRPQRSRPARDYNHMENRGGIDPPSANSSTNSAASTSAAGSPSPDGLEDTIVVDDTAPPGHDDCPSDDEIENLPAPSFADTTMTDAEKLDATKRWAAHRTKHEKKKRQKNSFCQR
jgi:hypothetical protein